MLRVVAVIAVAMVGTNAMSQIASNAQTKETITLGGGCFWCTEAVFEQLKEFEHGSESLGRVINLIWIDTLLSGEHKPAIRACLETKRYTGHAEVSQITFDPKVISLKEILKVFFTVHDPTTLNQQGNDVGTQYRSAIFYRNAEQKTAAKQVIKEIQAAKIWNGRIVTELEPFKEFYKAEDYHQEYFRLHGQQPYCRVVIAPKVAKFREHFRDKLKDN